MSWPWPARRLPPGEDRRDGFEKDLEIGPQGAALDVADVELHLAGKVDFGAPADSSPRKVAVMRKLVPLTSAE